MKILGFNISRTKARPIKRHLNRGAYKIVDGFEQYSIAPSSCDKRTEDEVLSSYKREKLLDLTRNLVRNSSLFNTILGQLTTNVVSSCGGKVILNFRNEELNKSLKKYFSEFTRNADFYTGDTYNKLLKRILREYIIGGGCVLLFDDGLIEDSGKILLFESSEIVNTTDEAIKKHYGKHAFQSQGKVYNANGRHIGTVVSRSQRGVEIADPLCCFFLHKDPNENPMNNNWFHFESNWREGRGVSQAAAAISTIHQLEDLVSSELMASRRNALIFCWLTQHAGQEEEVPSAFNDETDFDNMTDEQVEQAAKAEVSGTQTISFNKARENSVVYEALPEGIDAKQLQTTHPNSNVETMVDWLANRCASTMGLSKIFATGNPDDSNFRANLLFTFPVIVELQKQLEQICDWTFKNWLSWSARKNELRFDFTSEELDASLDWEWKGIDDLDEVAHQTAVEMKIRNCTGTLKDELGSDWKAKMLQIKEEIDFCVSNNIPHPAFLLKSGGQAVEVEEALK